MEEINTNDNDQAASYSWWWDSHNCSNHSQWLHSTLLDLDQKTKTMLNLIQEDGDSFAKRAEMFYEKRPELIKMVEEFHRSYRCLALKHDSFQSTNPKQPSDHNVQISSPSQLREFDNKMDSLRGEVLSNDQFRMWNETRMKVSKLIEDNLVHQDELIRRNDEKRELIKDLYGQINRLVDENKALRKRVAGGGGGDDNRVGVKQKKKNRSTMSRLRGLIRTKLCLN